MPKATGKSFLLYKGTSPSGTLVASCRTNSFSIDSDAVDATTKDSNNWQELLANAGIKKVSMNCAGLLESSATADAALTDALDGSIDAYYLEFNNGDRLSGSFQISGYQANGAYNGVQEFSFTLNSSGAVTYTNA